MELIHLTLLMFSIETFPGGFEFFKPLHSDFPITNKGDIVSLQGEFLKKKKTNLPSPHFAKMLITSLSNFELHERLH